MTGPVLIDLTHTSHTAARTGIQRVARGLWKGLGTRAEPVTWDPYQKAWRRLAGWEWANLGSDAGAERRGAEWPARAKVSGWLARIAPPSAALAGTALVVPEIFSPAVAAALPRLFAAVTGPRVAIFHDALALRHPEWAAPKTVARLPAYLQELRRFDGIAAVSEASRVELAAYFAWLGVEAPPLVAIPNGVDPPPPPATPPAGSAAPVPTVLCVGSLEARKNHLSLLAACVSLWSAGLRFRLRLIGLVQPETGAAAAARVRALQAAGRDVVHDASARDADLEAAYAECAFTVYPSLAEGFGLPVAESLIRGKPCVCSAGGALGEIARGGGCRLVESPDARQLAEAIGELLQNAAALAALAQAARQRRFKTTADQARELDDWMSELPRRLP